jgi:hypothetical protein
MSAVAAAPRGRAWMVGFVQPAGQADQIVVEHWNGRAWHVVRTGLGPDSGSLSVVRVARNGDVWATGFLENDALGTSTILVHEHAGTWTSIPGSVDMTQINDVLAVSRTDVWAVGQDFTARGPEAVMARWDGSTWMSQVPSAKSGAILNEFSISPDFRGQPQWVGLPFGLAPSSTEYLAFGNGQFTAFPGATPVAPQNSVTLADTSTAHIPFTNATWAVGSIDVLLGGGTPLIEFNAG